MWNPILRSLPFSPKFKRLSPSSHASSSAPIPCVSNSPSPPQLLTSKKSPRSPRTPRSPKTPSAQSAPGSLLHPISKILQSKPLLSQRQWLDLLLSQTNVRHPQKLSSSTRHSSSLPFQKARHPDPQEYLALHL